jgi:hypothetical protein
VSALIYDIGLHSGRDTGHYLREGCQAVAIDANPAMCAAAETQFCNYLRTGQLKIINRGVAKCKNQLEFWVYDDVSEWSSIPSGYCIAQWGKASLNPRGLHSDN